MKLPIVRRHISFLLASVLVIWTGCVPGSPDSSDLDGSLADDSIEFREAWIAMPDTVRLAADLWVPEGGDPDQTYPVLLEYLPYLKNESRARNFGLYSYFVQRGYVVARVDIRGSGNSEGKLIEYEYTDQEQEDGEVVIDWLSKQPFSNGNIGMFGISWGGFNSIHMAMRSPPALKAIIAIEATDDLYEDDVHYMDGIAHVDSYEAGQDLANIVPAGPDYIIDEEYIENRFDTKPWMLIYKSQQLDGSFWDRASLNTRYDSIKIPTFVIGGWYDQWLKGEDTGIMDEPAHTSVRTEYSRTILVNDRELLFEAVLDFYTDLENFYYFYTRRLFENGKLLWEKTWDETIPRKFH